jgi:hypothetical protein
MRSLISHLRHTIRLLIKSPGFTITAILILGLGIGGNTAIYSLIEAVLHLDRDLIDGFLQRCGVDSVAHYRKALQLSEQYAPKHLTRALDILQVAAALLLKPAEFVSFDLRQRRLASDVGLKLLPVRLNP